VKTLAQDLRYALHQLRANPRFAAVAVLTLALGIGANTAIFSAVNRLMLDPLPYPDAASLVYIAQRPSPQSDFRFPVPGYAASAWREQARSLDGVEAYSRQDLLVADDRGARLVHGIEMTPGLPAFLGVRPMLGRAFSADDARSGAAPVVILGAAMWKREYGASADVLGRVLTVDGVARAIVGVMPPDWDAFAGRRVAADVWLPRSLDAAPASTPAASVDVMARLRPGVSLEQARNELDALATRAQEAVPNVVFVSDFRTIITRPGEQNVDGRTRDALLALLAAVGLVLLVACANVANLLLARGAGRTPEIALRTALGAPRSRIVRQLMTESLLLAVLGGAAGVGIGAAALHVLMRLQPGNLGALRGVGLDPLVLGFTLALSLATGLLFGLLPAVQQSAANLGQALRHGGSGLLRRGGTRLRGALVAAEMAISVVLLVGAGLLVRSVVYLQHVDVGFDTRNVFAVQLALPRGQYQAPASRDLFAEQMLERIRRIPDVAAASQAFAAPPNFVRMIGGQLESRGGAVPPADARRDYAFNYVDRDYFETLAIPLLKGRTFSDAETGAEQAVIVNETMAKLFWPGQEAVGKQLRENPKAEWATVVGVAGDIAAGGLTQELHVPQLYRPYRAEATPMSLGRPPTVVLIVRAKSDPAAAIASIRRITQALDSDVAIPSVLLTETALAASIAVPRFNMALFSAFAVLALVLASVGLAAIIGQAVGERTHEIGIRMALGAREGSVLRLVVTQGLRAAAIGIGAGLIGALAVTRVMSSMLYGVPPRDPLTYAGVTLLLAGVAFVATWLPARRATRVDPVLALRAE
jgi:predicted permease